MVDEDGLDLGAAESGQPGSGRQRQARHLGMGGVDDLGGDLDRRLGRLARRGGIAGERQQHADLDRVGRQRRPRQRRGNDRRGEKSRSSHDRFSPSRGCVAASAHGSAPPRGFATPRGPRIPSPHCEGY